MDQTSTPREELHQAIGALVAKSVLPDSPFLHLLENTSHGQTIDMIERGVGEALLKLRLATHDPGFYVGFDRMIGAGNKTGDITRANILEYVMAIDGSEADLVDILPKREKIKEQKARGAGQEPVQ